MKLMGEWLSKEEAAESIGVSPKTVQRWIAQGKLKVFHKGRVLRIRKAELEAFMMKVDLSAILIPPEEAAKSGTIDDGAVEPLLGGERGPQRPSGRRGGVGCRLPQGPPCLTASWKS